MSFTPSSEPERRKLHGCRQYVKADACPVVSCTVSGATTLDEYRKYIEKDPALERRFQPVMVDEPTVEDTISILRGLKDRYEVYHGVKSPSRACSGGNPFQPLYQ